MRPSRHKGGAIGRSGVTLGDIDRLHAPRIAPDKSKAMTFDDACSLATQIRKAQETVAAWPASVRAGLIIEDDNL